MDDRYKKLMERSVVDAVDIAVTLQQDEGVDVGGEFVRDISIQMYQYRCMEYMQQKAMMRSMASMPDTAPGGMMQ